jgi:2',3'-cyclic-nucleotide 2'-phosphodiesterase (5'-nucleotidase family)
LVFFTGSTFVPSETVPGITPEFLRTKRDVLTELLGLLKVTAVAPSGEDGSLGREELRRLSQQTAAPFLSANLAQTDGTLLFPPSKWFTVGGLHVLVIGLSGPDSKQYPLASDLRLLPIRESLRSVMHQIDHPPDMVFILSSVSRDAQKTLLEEVPALTAILGGSRADKLTTEAETVGPSSLYLNSEARGRSVGWITLDAKKTERFFNPALGRARVLTKEVIQNQIAELAEKKTPTQRDKAELHDAQAALKTLSLYALTPDVRWSLYQSGAHSLNPTYANPENPVTARIEDFKRKTRDLALDSSDPSDFH